MERLSGKHDIGMPTCKGRAAGPWRARFAATFLYKAGPWVKQALQWVENSTAFESEPSPARWHEMDSRASSASRDAQNRGREAHKSDRGIVYAAAHLWSTLPSFREPAGAAFCSLVKSHRRLLTA
jgi:hypothetical protein